MVLETDIISGDIGSVRNNLALLVKKEVKEIVSLSQSSYSQNMLTVIIIYVPKDKGVETLDNEDIEYKPLCECGGQCQCFPRIGSR